MDKETKVLEIGDVIFRTYHGEPTGRYVIKRVTATLAMTEKEHRFRRDITGRNGYVARSPKPEGYEIQLYKIGTPELEEKFRFSQLADRLEKVKWNTLTVGQLISITALLPEKE